MNKSRDIENKIKEGFESVQHKAPKDLWTSIDDTLDHNSVFLDEKVKTSFESNKETAPDEIWAGIDKQLTIDRGWKKVHVLLQRRTFYKWTKRVAAFLIFLFFVTPEVDHFVSDTNKERSFSQNKNDISPGENSDQTSSIKHASSKTALKDESVALDAVNNAKSSIQEENENIQPSRLNNGEDQPRFNSKKYLIDNLMDSIELSKVKSNNSDHQIVANSDEKEQLNDSLSISKLPIKSIASFPTQNINKELVERKENVRNDTKFEIGLFSAFNSTAIINNLTRRTLDAESLVAFSPSFGTSFGLQFNYNFNPKHSLAGIFSHANIKQSYEKFSNGNLNDEMLSANFIRLQALYQFRHKKFESKKTSLNVKVGPYIGLMRGSSYTINDQVFNEKMDHYNNYDFGVTFQAGQSYELKKIIFDYGINIDKGLTNLNKGTNLIPASFDRTTILGVGGYLSIRYKL